MELVVSIAIASASSAALLWFGRYSQMRWVPVSRVQYINTQVTYQLFLMLMASIVLLLLALQYPANFTSFMQPGTLSARARGVSWLGTAEGESWLEIGAGFSVTITLVTTLFIYLRFRQEWRVVRQILPLLPWIFLFSLSNSFGEEVVFRLGFIVPLAGQMDPAWICLFSALFFGIPHLRGMPDGIAGALMAGFLGWLLARSVMETHGIFWAWFIHFLQDVVIYAAFVMSAIGKGDVSNPSEDGVLSA